MHKGLIHSVALNFAELGQHHLQNEGLGVDFAGVNDDITPTGLAASTQVESQELASTRGDNSWVSYPESPDRRSWSTLSTSSGEILSDFSEVSNMSDMPCLTSELSSGLGMTLSREDTTPMLPQQTTRKPNNRRVAQPPLHHSYRRSPYPLDHSRSRSASIASQSLPRTRCPTPLSFINDDFSYPEPALSTGVSSETMSSGILSQDIGDFDTYFDERPLATQQTPYKHDNVFMPTSFEDCFHHDGGHSVLHSSSDFSLHQTSSSSDHRCESHYADFADPPDLFGPLQEDQLSPPPEDMNPEDPDMTPRKQELRFEGDLYTPKYVRGHGNKREGWCGICKPGRWLVLKNSAFWYDKSFSHGISAATGTAFDGPRDTRRMSGNPDVWEGLCGSCGDWIALISSKKKGTTWFRHAYKVSVGSRSCLRSIANEIRQCHTHQKVKDTPKRRREANQNRIAKLSKSSKAEHEGKHELSETLEPELNDELELPARAVSTLQTITAMI